MKRESQKFLQNSNTHDTQYQSIGIFTEPRGTEIFNRLGLHVKMYF